jgi:two-component system, NtrC family, response regulator AtoC
MPNNLNLKPLSIFVVEDDEWYNRLLCHSLKLNPDYTVEVFFSGKDLVSSLEKNPDIITLDYRLPDCQGADLFEKIKSLSPNTEVIFISEQDDIEVVVDLLKMGAYDYLVKSPDIRDRLLTTVDHIRKNIGLKDRIVGLVKEVQQKYSFEKDLIGQSDAIKQVYNLIAKALNTNITVSVTGETGTGKEVVAKTIHYNSNRKEKPFVAVNVAAIPKELIESELFGHEKGAFTGALNTRKGKFEEANSGTLFLDEIGEMDLNAQTKLLRALQEREVVRVGNNKPISVDCRIIVATNRNLQDEVREGRFREDLYYRLLGINIHLPPLRERGKDVLVLAQVFNEKFSKENNLDIKPFSTSAKNKLLSYSWPGNIRELKSIVELAVVMSGSDEISDRDIVIGNNSDILPDLMSETRTMREYMIRIVQEYMVRFDGNTKKVADVLDIGQTTVYRLLKEAQD